MRAMPDTATQPSPWSPFRHRAFAILWTATTISNIGSAMNDAGNGWLMTTLSSSAFTVALVQSATTLPVLLFALVAGALADIFDKRRLLIGLNIVAGLLAAGFAALVWTGLVNEVLLLGFAFLMGTTAAFMAPAWQAVVPRLVPRPELQPAIALNSLAINIGRAVGPAVGGVLIVILGLAAPFVVNALSFVAIVLALWWWRPAQAAARRLPPESVFGAMRAGLRYAGRSRALLATLYRAAAFFVFASAFWALLPLLARNVLGGSAGIYGLLVGGAGVGAVAGAVLLPWLKSRLDTNQRVAVASLLMAATMAVLGLAREPWIAALACFGAGLAWIVVLATVNVSAQTALPDWVRGRGLALALMTLSAGLAGGSMLWGALAQHIGIPGTLFAAAAIGALAVPLVARWRLGQGDEMDLSPSLHWPAPPQATEVGHDRGPVLVTVEYQVAEEDGRAFLEALHHFAHERRRDGAFAWHIFEDTERPGLWIETFMVESWLEHLRQHDRVTEADRAAQEIVHRFHRGDAPPGVRHFIAPARE